MKLKWRITFAILIVAVASTFTMGYYAWVAIQTAITSEAIRELNDQVRINSIDFNADIKAVISSRVFITRYMENTFDLARAKSDPTYMQVYMFELGRVVHTAAQMNVSHSAYVYFLPELLDQPYDTWYTDLTSSGSIIEQPHFEASFFDPALPHREWFYKPIHTREPQWTKPYVGQQPFLNEGIFISHTGPVFIRDQIIAVAGVDYVYSDLVENIEKIRHSSMERVILLDSDYHVLIHPQIQMGGDYIDVVDADEKKLIDAFEHSTFGSFEFTSIDDQEQIMSYRKLDNGWIFAFVLNKEQIQNEVNQKSWFIIAISLGVVVAGFITSIYLGDMISKPINYLVKSVVNIGAGDYQTDIAVDMKSKNNEFNLLFEAIGVMQDQIRQDIEDAAESKEVLENMNDLLVRRNDQLNNLNAAKGQFLANMSHEIRTPLNGIMGSLQLIEMIQTDEQRELIGISKSSTQALLDVLNGILDYSKLEMEKMQLESTSFNLSELLAEVLSLFESSVMLKGLQHEHNIAEDVPRQLIGDPFRLKQVLSNLIGNAVKYTQKGGVNISVQLIETIGSRACLLKFDVEDTGVGITDKDLTKLFEPFSQVDSSNTRVYGGTGLGLSIAKGLVESMKGTIGVESQAGKGSVFYFTCLLTIDSSNEEESLNPEMPAAQIYEDKPVKILLVEDDQVSQMIIEKYIQQQGWEISIAVNGSEAVELYQQFDFDIVLMDIQMPIMDGYEATHLIRKIQKKHTPIVAMTAHVDFGKSEDLSALGIDDYLIKPINFEIFYEVIQKWTAIDQRDQALANEDKTE